MTFFSKKEQKEQLSHIYCVTFFFVTFPFKIVTSRNPDKYMYCDKCSVCDFFFLSSS
nr:MAG TPA: hypothetical protein [Caudoviricetes sp.]